MTKSPPALNTLWKTGSFYVGSFWLNSTLPLLLTPVLTRFLSPSDYGVMAMWQVLLTVTIPIVGLSTHTAINRRYFKKNLGPSSHHFEMRDYIASVAPILAITSLSVFFTYALLYPLIIRYLLPTSPIWIFLVPAVAIGTFVYNVVISYLNAEMRPSLYALFNNGNVLTSSIIAIFLIAGLGWNWQGRIAGVIAGISISALGGLFYLGRRGLLSGKIRIEFTVHALMFSLPLLPHVLSSMARNVSDRVFLSQIADLHEIGLFSAALALTGVFNILGNAAMQAWMPWLFAHLGTQNVNRVRIVKITYAAFAALALIGATFAAFSPYLFRLVLGPRFEGSTQFVWWLTSAAVLQGAYYFIAPYITYVERNKYSSYISIATLAVNLTLNFILIYFFGVMGIAAANFFTALYEFVAVFIVANYCMPMPWMSVFYRTTPALSSAENPGGSGS